MVPTFYFISFVKFHSSVHSESWRITRKQKWHAMINDWEPKQLVIITGQPDRCTANADKNPGCPRWFLHPYPTYRHNFTLYRKLETYATTYRQPIDLASTETEIFTLKTQLIFLNNTLDSSVVERRLFQGPPPTGAPFLKFNFFSKFTKMSSPS